MSYDFMQGYTPPQPTYNAHGRFKVNIVYKFYNRLNNSRYFNDTRQYDTDKQRDERITQSFKRIEKLAKAYNTQIYSISINKKIYTPSNIAIA